MDKSEINLSFREPGKLRMLMCHRGTIEKVVEKSMEGCWCLFWNGSIGRQCQSVVGKKSCTWSGRNQDKLEFTSTSDFSLPSSYLSNLQRVRSVTLFLLSISYANFSLDNFCHLSTVGILESIALAYRLMPFNNTIVHPWNLGIYISLLKSCILPE